MEIDGTWKVRYAVRQQPPFTTEEGDEEEAATITLKNSEISGRDPWGYEYSGKYSLTDGRIKASITATPYEQDAGAIFDGVRGQFHLNLEGEFNSPNYFSMRGSVVEAPSQEVVINCTRIVGENI
jgi:hypothetical protein